jgi:nucleoside-diphosphate-sugar epimerase
MSSLSAVRVLVTGGSGFIGGRVVARLAHSCGARVRVLVRDVRRATQVARYPVELCRGDLSDPADVLRAADGCELIVHCAIGTTGTEQDRRRVTVVGTEHVLAAAARARIKRLVHVSTAAVYGGNTPDAVLTEDATPRYTGVHYADSKLDAENAVRAAARTHGFEAVICQPTIVYGPFGRTFTTNVVEQLKTGRVILVNGGVGTCNAVYVDDVVTALLLAATSDRAPGETFLISGPDTVTWAEFYGRYQRLLGLTDRLEPMAEKEAREFSDRPPRRRWLLAEAARELRHNAQYRDRLLTTADGRVLSKALRAALPRFAVSALKDRGSAPATAPSRPPSATPLPLHRMHPSRISTMASRSVVQTAKAERLLGYRPVYTFDRGMQLTWEWVRWAGLD